MVSADGGDDDFFTVKFLELILILMFCFVQEWATVHRTLGRSPLPSLAVSSSSSPLLCWPSAQSESATNGSGRRLRNVSF